MNNISMNGLHCRHLLAFFLFLLSLPMSAQFTDETNGIVYTPTNDTECELTNGTNCTVSRLEIPETVDNNGTTYTITSIADRAFERCKIEILIIPATVKKIGSRCFTKSTSLEYIFVEPENLVYMTIDGSLYEKDSDNNPVTLLLCLKNYKREISLPETVTRIGELAFERCSWNVEIINLPASVRWIDAEAFNMCSRLETINLSRSLEDIGDQAFANCDRLKVITIPASVKKFGRDIFSFTALRELHMQGTPPDHGEEKELVSSLRIPDCKIYVPFGYKNMYCDFYWASYIDLNYNNIIEEGYLYEDSEYFPFYGNENGPMHINRTISNEYWSTICLPFSVSSNMVNEVFGEGTVITEFTGEVINNVMMFEDVTEITAGVPCLIKPAQTVKNPQFKSVEITAPTARTIMSSDNKYGFTGIYCQTPMATDGSQLFFTETGALAEPTEEDNTILGLRAFIVLNCDTLPDVSINGNVVSGISNVTTGEAAGNRIYNISGQYVGTSLHGLAKGVYVNNGKKVVVK